MSNSLWHFPRTDFAERVMQSFLSGGSTALTLFAPRRTGKTQFLVHDLAPTAEKQKCTVVYASFWQTADTPVATLIHAVEGAGNGPGFWRRTGNAFSARLCTKSSTFRNFVCGDLVPGRFKGKCDPSEVPPSRN